MIVLTNTDPRYDRVREFREDHCYTWREIGDILGISLQRAWDIYNDPDGTIADARKRRHNRPCVDCGKTISNGGSEPPSRCLACATIYTKTMEYRAAHPRGRRKTWSDDEIIALIRGLAETGPATTSRYRALYEQVPKGTMPSLPTILIRYGSWRNAIAAAGVEFSRPSTPLKYKGSYTRNDVVDAVLRVSRPLRRPATRREYIDWRQDHHDAPSDSMCRKIYGNWTAIVRDVDQVLREEQA